MRMFILFLSAFCLLISASGAADAQNMTIILVRHAEKDTSPAAYKTDADLTAAGRERAARLFEVVKPFQPENIFSTQLKRTLNTATPAAQRLIAPYRMQVQFYDYGELEDFAARLLKLKSKCVLVVGHNTTTPELANLLIGKEKYQTLGDNEYDKMFIIKIKGKKITDRVVEY